MSDYIKREDALTAFAKACKGKVLKVLSDHQIIKAFRDNINNLPTIEVSEDCISREQIIEAHYEWCNQHHGESDVFYTWSLKLMKDAPSVVPSRAKGEWLLDGRCSNCLQAPLTTHKTYCPNCGAKMKG